MIHRTVTKRYINNNPVPKKERDYIDLIGNTEENDYVKKLFINVFPVNNMDRKHEYDICLENIAANKSINHVYLICEPDSVTDEFLEQYDKERATCIMVDKRPTFYDMFKIINKNISDDEIAILANRDVYFDDTLEYINLMNMNDVCLALTRYDKKGNEWRVRNKGSQDVWIFKGKAKKILKSNSDFYLGQPGCDNRIAYEFDSIGYKVINPSLSIKAYHVHQNKTEYMNGRVPQPYLFPDIIALPIAFDTIDENKGSNKKIMLIGINLSEQTCLQNALKEYSNEFQVIEWRKTLREEFNGNIRNLQNYLLYEILKFRPNLIFMQIQRSGIINGKIIELINKVVKCDIVNWTGDVRRPLPEWYKDVGKYENVLSVFSSEEDAKELTELRYKAKTIVMGYEHIAFDKNGSTRKDVPDIVFFGNNYGNNTFPLSVMRFSMVKTLIKKFGKRFQVYGAKWPAEFRAIDLNHKNYKEAEIYRSCKIAIGISHFDLGRYAGGRLTRAMGSGAFYLVKKYPNYDIDFENGKHLVVWHDLEELINYINYYLSHEDERKKIALQGYTIVKEQHRWNNKIKEILHSLNWWS